MPLLADPMDRLNWIQFRNDSGEQIPAFGVMRITGLVVVEAGEVAITVAKPNTYGSQYSHAINGYTAVGNGQYGFCTLGQPMPAYYDSSDGTPAAGELWGPRNATWKLKKNTGGFRAVGVTNSTRHLVLVTPEPFLRFRGTADASIAADATGTVSIFYRSGASAYTDTTVNVTVLNDLDGEVPSGSMVECVYDPYSTGTEGWRIVQADCP